MRKKNVYDCSWTNALLLVVEYVNLLVLLCLESTRLKLFQKLIETYTEAHKDKNGNDLQLEVSTDWKEVKKLKDSDLEVAVNNKISELKKLSTNKKV